MSVGLNGFLGIKQESAFGTQGTPATVYEDIISETIKSDNAILTPKTCNGQRALKRVLPGPYKANGDINLLANPEGVLPWLLKGLFGQVSTSDLGGGAYSHVFAPLNNSALPSFTIHVDRLAGAIDFVGSSVSSIEWTGNVDEEVKIAASVMTQKPIRVSKQVATINDLDPLVWADCTVTLNSVADTNIENLSIKISNDIEQVSTHNGTRFVKRNVAKDFSVEGSCQMEFNDEVQLQRFWGAASCTSPQRAVLTNVLQFKYVSLTQIGSSGQYYTMQWDVPMAIWTAGEATLTGPNDRLMQDLTFVAKTNGTYPVQFTLINSQASYPNP